MTGHWKAIQRGATGPLHAVAVDLAVAVAWPHDGGRTGQGR
ncbi:hypothetical protein ACFV98_42710 [Streptomyces violascens]